MAVVVALQFDDFVMGPERRIDWIWITPDLAASDAATLGRAASDHLGVAATLETLP